MALVKTVEMRILADAGDAQRKLDEMDAKAKSLDGNAIRMRFRLDTAEGRAQLDAIKMRADELGYKDVSIKVRVDGAGRAVADLMAVKHEEDRVRDTGIMNRIGNLFGGAGGGIPGQGTLPFLGSVPLPAIAAAVPLAGALATEIVGVASGFAAAATGAGAFAALALPAVKKVEAAYQSLGKAQQAYQLAQAKEQLDPTKANKNALASAGLNLKVAQEQISKLPASEQAAIKGISSLSAEFGKMSRAFQPQAFKVFADGLKIVGNLMPHVTPFASTFAAGLDKLLQQAAKFTQSKGFENWLKQFHGLEGPAIASIGHGIGEVANSFGKLLTVMSGKDVAHALNIGFGAISGTISVVTSYIHRLMENFDQAKAFATSFGHAVAGAFKSIGSGAVSFQNTIDHAFMAVIHGAEQMVSGVVHAVSGLAGKIKGAFAGAAGWLVSAGRAVIEGLIHGIESGLGALEGVVSKVAGVVKSVAGFLGIHSPSTVMHGYGTQIVAGLIEGMRSGVPEIRIASEVMAQAVLKAFRDRRTLLKAELAQSVQVAQSEISANSIMNAPGTAQGGPLAPVATSDVITGMQQQVAQVKAFAAAIRELKKEGLNATSLSQIIGAGSQQGLPVAQALLSGGKQAVAQVNALQKQLRSEAARLGDAAAGPMAAAGRAAAQGLAKGILSEIGAVDEAIRRLARSMAATARNALKARSPSLVFAEIGRSIPQGVALGISLGASSATSASARLAAKTVQPWNGAAGGGGAGLHVHFHGITPADKYATAQQVHQVLRDYKRDRGGAALGLG